MGMNRRVFDERRDTTGNWFVTQFDIHRIKQANLIAANDLLEIQTDKHIDLRNSGQRDVQYAGDESPSQPKKSALQFVQQFRVSIEKAK